MKKVHFRIPYLVWQEKLAGISLAQYLAQANLYVFVPEYLGAIRQTLEQTNFNLSAVNRAVPEAVDDADKTKYLPTLSPPPTPTTDQFGVYLDDLAAHMPKDRDEAGYKIIQQRRDAAGAAGVPLLAARLPWPGYAGQSFV